MKLQLSLKRKWFEMTKAGIKKEDYREINTYWVKRLTQYDKNKYQGFTLDESVNFLLSEESKTFRLTHAWIPDFCVPKLFTNNIMTLGYPSNENKERILKIEHKGIEIRTGNPEWGAEPNKLYFVIKHGKIL